MPASFSPLLQPECHISPSQEEVLANLAGGWERSEQYVLDETPSQQLLIPDVATIVPDGSGSRSESSDSEDRETNMGFTQEPVEWASPPSSPPPLEGAKEIHRMEREDSYNAAFESDRSQSPGHYWNGEEAQPEPKGRTSMVDTSAELITQPPPGAMPSQSPAHLRDEDEGDTEKRMLIMEDLLSQPPFEQLSETLPLDSPTNSSSPSNRAGVSDGRNFVEEWSAQPITQPPFGTQPFDSLIETQEPATEVQQESGRDNIVPDNQLLENESGELEERNVQDPVHSSEVAGPATEQDILDLPQEEQIRACDGDTERNASTLKRVASLGDLQGEGKMQRIKASPPMRARSFPKTVMDVCLEFLAVEAEEEFQFSQAVKAWLRRPLLEMQWLSTIT